MKLLILFYCIYIAKAVDGYKDHGRCELDTRYMMHPSDSCDKDSFEEKDND